MSNYAVLRFSKRKAGGVASADRHNERKKAAYKSNPNIDRNRSKLNYHLVKPKGTYKAGYLKRIDEVGCKVRSNSVVMVETLITASPEFINKMDQTEQRLFFERALQFISSRVGKNNIISAVVHMDETTPHMHLSFCPITEKGRLSAKDVLGNRQAMSEWQDQFYGYMSKFYPELQRGLPKAVTGRKHIPSYMFKYAAELSKSYPILKKLDSASIFNAKTVKKDVMHDMSHIMKICSALAGKVKDTEDYIGRLEAALKEKDELLEKSAEQKDEIYGELILTIQKTKELQQWQRKAQQIIDGIPEELKVKIGGKIEQKHDKGSR